jgi:hypothetical protein
MDLLNYKKSSHIDLYTKNENFEKKKIKYFTFFFQYKKKNYF